MDIVINIAFWLILIVLGVVCICIVLAIISFFIPKKHKKIVNSIGEIEMSNVKNLLKQLNESLALINNTKEPEVFIKRYEFAIEVCKKLVQYENKIAFTGTLPSVTLQNLETLSSKESYEKEFILRYSKSTEDRMYSLKTEKGQTNRVSKFYYSLEVNFDFFSDNGLNLIEDEYDRLLNIVISRFKV